MALLRRLLHGKRGNIAVAFAFTAAALVFLIGMGIDYTSAVVREDQLNADADAAALAALRPSLLTQSDAAAIAVATDTFNAQASAVSGITYDAKSVKVTASDTTNGTKVKRTITVSYNAASKNAFMGVLGKPSIAISGSSQATASAAPNIDFYLLLDDSPSMAIAATPAGINTMVAHTPHQGGCAFGCHQKNPAADNLGNPGGIDNYALARQLGVTLRIDLLRQAAQDLMTTAQQAATSNGAQYQMAIYTFDVGFNTIQSLTSSLTLARNAAGTITMLEVDHNNWLTSSVNNQDADTDYDNAMTRINAVMPAPGNGTNAAGDTPQEVLFFVTDGVEDEMAGGVRKEQLMDPARCKTIKDRGIRIAVLYTSYLPLPTNAWYNQHIASFQSQIGPTLQTCASPGLYFEVQSGGDISAALTALFEQAVITAHLSK
ncbi:MAG TPA: pilus assembly protein TadG-related protein [Stellaceae bacterium]|nr:pilus assembly protein TadG-related protein [Stellaceae bacterium]